jgi:membrane-associated phospholipid phosphatase
LAADQAILGGTPGVLLNPYVGMPQDEIMHFFYFSYYLVVLGGGSFAYIGSPFTRMPPAPGFELAVTSVTASFLFAFIWYPYLPARGPWESPELMAGLTPFQGLVFTPWIETIIAHGAVSGGCFPSGHVAGTFGMSFGLLPSHPRAGRFCLFLAIGMACACLYTRYHHGLDIVAGLACAGLGYGFARMTNR